MKEQSTIKPASVISFATDIVAIEQGRVNATRLQLAFDNIGDGRFAGAG
jgi:hypothetical protein